VRLVPQASGVLREVSDDGRAGRAPEGAGLRGLRERVESCGGTLERRTDDGTQLRLLIPHGPAARVARDLARNAS
jgi:signal transduction histidine kinase